MPKGPSAFCPWPVRVAGAANGPLSGLHFAAKDLFDVAGHVTGCGNPEWKRTHRPASRTAPAVRVLLDAGAGLVGKTITDELAFSLVGRNYHYGTPANPAAPGRIPGGSSCGSASAVSAGLVDFALGTDTAGSVRVPASLCGVFGFRPTHAAVSAEGVMPLAPSFDTVGWLAREAGVLARVGAVLLPPDKARATLVRAVVASDAFALADLEVENVLREAVRRAEAVVGTAEGVRLAEAVQGDLSSWNERFRSLQAREVCRVHGAWIASVKPRFGPEIEARFRWASTVSPKAEAEAAPLREAFARRLDEILADGAVLCVPTTPCVAPRLDADERTLARFRERALALTCVAGLARLPQVTLPAGLVRAPEGDRCPVGLSLVARSGSDRALLDLAERLASAVSGAAGESVT